MSKLIFPETTWAEIDLDALRHNAHIVRQLAPRSKIMAMLKADAYGHGLLDCASALVAQVDGLAVARLEQAAVLRQRYPRKPLLLTAASLNHEALAWCAQQQVAIVLHESSVLQCLRELSQWPPIWLKFNTGMNRLGFDADKGMSVLRELRQREVKVVAMTHFACADEPEDSFTYQQIRQFDAILEDQADLSQSLANSAGIIGFPSAHRDWVRPGLMLYGVNPIGAAYKLDLRPVMRLKAKILAVNSVPAGAGVGYGQTWRARQASRVATVGIGYGDGYPRIVRPGAFAVLGGQRVPVLGRVSMDLLALDVSPITDAAAGQIVELWGQQLAVAELAEQAGTIAYDLLCRVQGRVKRRLSGAGSGRSYHA